MQKLVHLCGGGVMEVRSKQAITVPVNLSREWLNAFRLFAAIEKDTTMGELVADALEEKYGAQVALFFRKPSAQMQIDPHETKS
jgi:hypothetical protein